MQILRNDCDALRSSSPQRDQTNVSCRHEGLSISVPITRQLFEDLTYDLLQRTADTTEFVTHQARLEVSPTSTRSS